MPENDANHAKSLRRIKTATLLVSLVALTAVLLALYAFMQKRNADEQAALAQKNIREAKEQQQKALLQRNISDSSREQAAQQRELALASEKRALLQQKIADEQAVKAEENRLEALKQQADAAQQKLYAAQQAEIAETNAAEAKKQKLAAETQTKIAIDEKQISNRLKELDDSRVMAKEAAMMMAENHYDSSMDKATEAYLLNKNNNGPQQNSDIYEALNLNWIKKIGNKNQFSLHSQPVHCISGIEGSDIIFSADEAGTLYESVIRDNSAQKIASYAIKDDVRGLAISLVGDKLAAITVSGNGILFKISASGISFIKNFRFPGVGKAVVFDETDNIIVASNKGISKYNINNLDKPDFINKDGINCMLVGRSGIFYIATENIVNVFRSWDDLTADKAAFNQKFESRVTSIAIDYRQQLLAAGTYNGYVWLSNPAGNNSITWSRALHLSSVNDLKFSTVNNGRLQLASAGADRTIKLVDVTSIIQRKYNEDILTLKGHNKWIYSLCYLQNGKLLCSAGEDNKIIVWKPTTNDLYKTLTEK